MEQFRHELSHSFTQQQIEQFKKALSQKKVTFFFRSSPELRESVAQDVHPILKNLPQTFKQGILLDNTIDLTHRLVTQYLEHKLIEPYKTMVTMGEIRVRSTESPKTASEILMGLNLTRK